LITFGAITLPLCAVTNSVRHNVDFRTEALNRIENLGAGVKSGRLASAELLWAVVSGQGYFLSGNAWF